MDERIAKYQDKMEKTLANLDSELVLSGLGVPIPMCWTGSRWIIMAPPHRCSRWRIFLYRKPE